MYFFLIDITMVAVSEGTHEFWHFLVEEAVLSNRCSTKEIGNHPTIAQIVLSQLEIEGVFESNYINLVTFLE